MNRLIKQPATAFESFVKKFFDDTNYATWFPTVNTIGHSNIMEKEKEFVVEVSLPGLKKDDVKIDLENDILTISSQKKESTEDKNDNYYRKEFHYGECDRSFTVPKNIDRDQISAKMEDGILTITLPKIEPDAKKNESSTIKIQ